jgi:hypothetical protein
MSHVLGSPVPRFVALAAAAALAVVGLPILAAGSAPAADAASQGPADPQLVASRVIAIPTASTDQTEVEESVEEAAAAAASATTRGTGEPSTCDISVLLSARGAGIGVFSRPLGVQDIDKEAEFSKLGAPAKHSTEGRGVAGPSRRTARIVWGR